MNTTLSCVLPLLLISLNVFAEVAAELSAAYDQWWQDVQPLLVNEDTIGPGTNPFQALYYGQFGGSPTAEDLAKMR